MFSVITNIHNKKTKGTTLMELFTATGKLIFFLSLSLSLSQLELFDVCTTSDKAHIDTIFKFLPHTRQHGHIDILNRHPVPVNCLYHSRVVLGGSFEYFARNARCTVTTDLLVWYSNTQNDFSPGSAIFSLHTLASPSGRNVNYDEKQLTGEKILSCLFYLYRFCKYVSYGFAIINFCNPGVHYETPCIMLSFNSMTYNSICKFDTHTCCVSNRRCLLNATSYHVVQTLASSIYCMLRG